MWAYTELLVGYYEPDEHVRRGRTLTGVGYTASVIDAFVGLTAGWESPTSTPRSSNESPLKPRRS